MAVYWKQNFAKSRCPSLVGKLSSWYPVCFSAAELSSWDPVSFSAAELSSWDLVSFFSAAELSSWDLVSFDPSSSCLQSSLFYCLSFSFCHHPP